MFRGFPSSFYIANTMEIFERLAWYGFFTLSSLYMTSPVEQGGLAFSETQRGTLQGIIPFFLYLLPVLTGALADRFGYRKMFLLSFIVMAPSYYLLGQVSSFGSFFVVFFCVALGAAIFKPVVVGTITQSTNDKNRGMGFGIFYTMVNVGGFLGPLVAGYVRAISWDMVFVMSSFWILVNIIPAWFWYRDRETSTSEHSLIKTLQQAQLVLGNGRFALFVFPIILLMMLTSSQLIESITWATTWKIIAAWFVIHLLWQYFSSKEAAHWYQRPVVIANKPFALYLLLMTGYWAVYLQLFLTMPLYIRDFVDTSDLVAMISGISPGLVSFFAFVDETSLQAMLQKLPELVDGSASAIARYQQELLHYKVLVPIEEIAQFAEVSKLGHVDYAVLAQQWAANYRQVNPEYLINIDFAAIVMLQLLVSYICRNLATVKVLITGVIIFSIACFLAMQARDTQVGGSLIVGVIFMMAIGEMVTSPKSQEYVAAISPQGQSALFMGYYYVSVALGSLFAGLLSGWAYGSLAKDGGAPDVMWMVFAGIGFATSACLLGFHIWCKKMELSGTVSEVTA